jgi:curli biogenesis system outer membrane secretion channel CsgG
MKLIFQVIGIVIALSFASCSTQSKVYKIDSPVQETAVVSEPTLKRLVAIGRFTNETKYGKGIFFDVERNNPLENQAADILGSKLVASQAFILLERQDFDAVQEEAAMKGNAETLGKVGADYLIFGSVTEFGRRVEGSRDLFSRTKIQTVYAGVSLRLVDVATGEVIYSEEGKGEASRAAKSSFGFGEQAGFDAALSDQAISAAISKLTENIIRNCTSRPWRSYILSVEDDVIIMAGGESQGLKKGDVFQVISKGKQVKNPQTGMMMELPGKPVAKVKVLSMAGNSPTSEFSVVAVTEGDFDASDISQYYLTDTTTP